MLVLELVMTARHIPGLVDEITTNFFNGDLQINVSMIGSVASLMMGQVNHCANENRKSYIQSIMSLIENTDSIQIFEFIINSVQEWIGSNLMINKKEQLIKQIMNRLYQSIKTKMNDSSAYLDIVHRIYLNVQSRWSGLYHRCNCLSFYDSAGSNRWCIYRFARS